MYAVIETGSKQYKVQVGDFIQIEKLEGNVGSEVKFDKVLLVAEPSDTASKIVLGKPYLASANVSAEIVAQGRDEKIVVFKYKTRKQYRKTQGHRQEQTQLIVTALNSGSGVSASLAAADKKAKMSKFFTNLKAKSALPKVKAEKEPAKAKAKKV